MYLSTYCGLYFRGKYFKMTRDLRMNFAVTIGFNKDPNGMKTYLYNRQRLADVKKCIPVSSFSGNFDGDGHTISGLYFNTYEDKRYKSTYLGLFMGCAGNISNLTISDSFILSESSEDCGMLVGSAYKATLTNCHVKSSVIEIWSDRSSNTRFMDPCKYYTHCGGIMGEAEDDVTIKNCSFDGEIYQNDLKSSKCSQAYIGGILGYSEGSNVKVEKCVASGNMQVLLYGTSHEKETYMAGIIGYNDHYHLDRKSNGAYKDVHSSKNWMNLKYVNERTLESDKQKGEVAISGISNGYGSCYDCVNFGDISASIDGYKSFSVYLAGTLKSDYDEYQYSLKRFSPNLENTCANYGNISFSDNSTKKTADCMIGGVGALLHTSIEATAILSRCNITTNRTDDKVRLHPLFVCSHDDYNKESRIWGYADCVTYNGKLISGKGWTEDEFSSTKMKDYVNGHAEYLAFDKMKDSREAYDKLLIPANSGGVYGEDQRGEGTKEKPYLVHNEDDLRFLQQQCSKLNDYDGRYIKLMNNITMSNKNMDCFWGFSGVFDGNGYYIQNLHASDDCLFGTVNGTIKNLTLKDIKFTNEHSSSFAGIAKRLKGSPQKKGVIENCVVTGILDIEQEPVEEKIEVGDNDYYSTYYIFNSQDFDGKKGYLIGGIVAYQDENTEIHNCLFDGDINYNCHKHSSVEASDYYPLVMGGIAGYSKGMVTNCTAAVGGHCWTQTKIGCVNGIVGFQAENHSNSNYYDNEFILMGWSMHNDQSLYKDRYDSKRYYGGGYDSYEYVCSLMGRKKGWTKTINGATPPNTVCYDAVDSDGKSVKISLTDFYRSSVVDNTIYRITPREGQEKDENMYNLPNVVVYSKDVNADMIMNGNLTPGKSLRYKSQNGSVKTYGMIKYEIKPNATGWHSLCLPGTVSNTMLPDSSKLYICGPNNGTKMMVVEVDSVPGGIPFFAYIPVKNKKGEDQTAVLNMKGQLVMAPQKACDDTPMLGTYEKIKVEGACSKLSDDGKTLTLNPDVEPFSGYAVNSTPLQLVERLMMEEHDDDIAETIKENMGYRLNLAVSRDFKAHEWTPICLPFEMDKDEIKKSFGEKVMLETLKGMDYDEEKEILNLKFAAAPCCIDAGKPYLIKPSVDVKGFAVDNCKLMNTPLESATYKIRIKGKQARVAFVGSFAKQLLVSTTEYNAYYMMNQKSLVKASTETPYQSYAFRGWFRATDAEGVTPFALGMARIVHEANEFTIEDDGKTDIPAEAYGTYAKGKLKYHRAIETDSLHTSLVLPFDVMKKDVDDFCDEIYVVKRVNRMANDKYDIIFEPIGNMGRNDMLDHNNAYYVKLKEGVDEIEFENDDVVDLTKVYVNANRTQVVQITTGGGAAVTEAPQYMAFGPSMCTIDDKSYSFYMYGDDGTFDRVDSVPPFRLYFYLSDSDGYPYLQQSQAKIRMAGKTTTGISEIKTTDAFKPRRLYSLDGKMESQHGKGVYIKDGKKIAVQ